MADLNVNYVYLDDLALTLSQIAGLVRLDDSAAAVDHAAVTESATVGAAGDDIVKFQTSLASTLADNIDVMSASVADASTAMSDTDKSLASGASDGGAH